MVHVPGDYDSFEECMLVMWTDWLSKKCGPTDVDKIWSKIFEGYLSVLVAVLGVIGNSTSLVVLKDQPFLDVFNKLLVSLTICDIAFLGKQNNQYN